ncbi:ABC transporter [Clostridium pasteurianum DSM 525 = ATCC 6013]|uniref:ABC transporter n=1 Tax=Clostridium pasteurianum DSM 525 = ATCC 6013 TaxID=1262449 RepID=A0A0H3J392_CLOPA|nr:ABC transporter ATP-binding protein [Clostridium pasteurianum]AJA46378.1 ABC transporter [Clostridium pasteurianum DSM 525 = ATCC 6013]AJA50366.1 ABC transporter [Clostridium pasteurianum DSM 525 = ATCC 6013]AOZ73815.1 ABC transporter ATP-binding protein [Clostridium pasteurianum DSM 525 = ATCC 6013]AOZ77612.1 ABC transporter ATP-binding protein [Clostridium pasteurianum]ELP60953.1 ABC transporter [Clostridium pasteurianum DSM 525 = ATCC 6013]
MSSELISVKNITKVFGKVIANSNIDFSVNAGEIHALLGENGAGKSTLMNMLSGVYTPDSGSIFIHGEKVHFSSPKDSIKAGVGMVFQHFKLVESMTARQNILLGQNNKLFIDEKNTSNSINEICEKFGFNIDLDKYVYDMSVGERQNLEILKILYRGADILILDEPTSVFTPQETKKLFNIMNRIKEQGCAVIFITHKLDEVMEVADRITILRKGEAICTVDKKTTNPKNLTELMVGKEMDLFIDRVEYKPGDTVLKVSNLNVLGSDNVKLLKDVNFEIKEGEIFGVAGIAGCGQKELCEAITGICNIESGKIIFKGQDISGKSSKEMMKNNIAIGFIPEDRLGMGLVGSMNIVDNLMLKDYKNQKGLLLNRRPLIEKAKKLVEKLEVKTPGIFYPIRYLSGGNIQKILLGRELSLNPKLIVMAYPVRGLDINTCYTIYNLINEEKQKGNSVLFVGEDLDVLMKLCDRIMVLNSGNVTGILEAKDATKEKLGMLMVSNADKGGDNYDDTAC